MRILTRYLLRAHLGPFLFSLSVLTGLLLINTVARRFEELAGKGLPISVIAEVFILSIPYTLALTFPMSVLVAVLYVFSQLTAENEITALKASGVNLIRFITPLLVVAVLFTGAMVWFNDAVLPAANHRLKNLLVDIGRKSPTLQFRERVINPIRTADQSTRYFLYAGRIDPATNHMDDVVIYDLSNGDRDRTIYADSGRMMFNADRTDLFLLLYDGWIHERDENEPARFLRMFFDEQVIRMAGVGDHLERNEGTAYRGDREMTVAMLRAEVRRRQIELHDLIVKAGEVSELAMETALRGPEEDARETDGEATAGAGAAGDVAAGASTAGTSTTTARPDTARTTTSPRRSLDVNFVGRHGQQRDLATQRTVSEFRSLVPRLDMLEQGINQYSVELHKKYAIPFACIVFVLIGAPLAVRFPRGGVGMVIAFSLVIFAIYWSGLTGGEQLGDRGHIRPFWAMWAVNVVFFALGIWALSRIGRESSTSRGGGWDDLLYTLRTLFSRRTARAGQGGRS